MEEVRIIVTYDRCSLNDSHIRINIKQELTFDDSGLFGWGDIYDEIKDNSENGECSVRITEVEFIGGWPSQIIRKMKINNPLHFCLFKNSNEFDLFQSYQYSQFQHAISIIYAATGEGVLVYYKI